MLKYALPALAVAGSAMASCSTSGTATIQNGGDASAIATCTTFTGSVAIATGTTGDLSFNSPLKRITGSFTAKGAVNITSLNGDSLQSIGGGFILNNVPRLATINFPQLTTVEGALNWEGLAGIGALVLTSGIQQAESFNLQNTRLSDLTGINLKECTDFYLANNGLLQAFSMQLSKVTGSITVQSNGDRMNVTFPNLLFAKDITIDNVPSISMPSLEAVNGSIGFNMNNELEELSLPNLTRVDEGFTIATNEQLKSFSVPKLETVGGAVKVQNNSVLANVTFPSLTEIGGAFNAYGNFSSVSLPKITDIRGDFNVQSTKSLSSSCDVFDNEHGSTEAIKGGNYFCHGGQTHPNSDPTGGNSDSSDSSDSGDNNSAGSMMRVPAIEISLVFGVIVAMVGML